jgi:hypothetical protein
MKAATLTILLSVATGIAATAQKLSLLPQIGVENSRTTVTYNNLKSFLPAGGVLTPQFGLRLDYQFKGNHGPYVAMASSRSVVSYNFSDPETGMNIYKASPADMQLRLQTGYMFSSKPIFFNKSGSSSKLSNTQQQKTEAKKNCGSYAMSSRCGKASEKAGISKVKNRSLYMRIQPSLGAAFVSPGASAISTSTNAGQTVYNYKAGNWNTAITGGVGFEFGKGKQRIFTIGINYLKGIGNLDEQTVSAVSGTKTSIAKLDSKASAWNVTAGIPITLSSKTNKPAKRQHIQNHNPNKSRCGQYKLRYSLQN